MDTGADANGNGALEVNEVSSTAYVCNGLAGASGPAGPQGPAGANGASTFVTASTESAGSRCAAGGVKLTFSSVAGAPSDAGASSTRYLCNGVPGAPGPSGSNGATTLVASESESPGGHCVAGGVKLSFGLDANGNGTLDPGEATATSFVCNGMNTTGVADAGSSCVPTGNGAVAVLGCPCTTPGALACAGNAQSEQLICFVGRWSPNGACPIGQTCDTSAATAGRCGPATAPSVQPMQTFVRWGRTTCPSDASVVYRGYVAGSHYSHTGGGANTLCLTDSPSWLAFSDANQEGALLYGTEYETSGGGLASALGALQNFDARCVVCEVPRPTQLMIPGATSCPGGWTLEYNGYLMANHYTLNRSEYVCVDANPEATGSSANSGGNFWYSTEVECGSLPCGPGGYVQGRELACAVCTK